MVLRFEVKGGSHVWKLHLRYNLFKDFQPYGEILNSKLNICEGKRCWSIFVCFLQTDTVEPVIYDHLMVPTKLVANDRWL